MTLIGAAMSHSLDRIITKGSILAAHLLECDQKEIEYDPGRYSVRNTNKVIMFRDVVKAAYHGASYPEGFQLGLEETVFHDPDDYNWPSALHLCTVLIDCETGKARLRDYFVTDDVGRVINPMIVEGQIMGGLAQGLGQALLEHCVYDPETGQLLTGSFMDYCIPRADDLPRIRLRMQETLNPYHPLGVKGAGESGTIGAPAAIVNAVVDGLWHLGVRNVQMPLSPFRVWEAIQAAEQRH